MFWQRVQHVPRECAAYSELKWGQVKSRRKPGMNQGGRGSGLTGPGGQSSGKPHGNVLSSGRHAPVCIFKVSSWLLCVAEWESSLPGETLGGGDPGGGNEMEGHGGYI